MRGKKKNLPLKITTDNVPVYITLESLGYGYTDICKALKAQHEIIQLLKETGWKEVKGESFV